MSGHTFSHLLTAFHAFNLGYGKHDALGMINDPLDMRRYGSLNKRRDAQAGRSNRLAPHVRCTDALR